MTHSSQKTSPFHATQLDILRHGNCEGGAIFRGHTDSALLHSGMECMLEQARFCDTRWDRVISSPLQRCADFAASWCRDNEIELTVDERLIELDFGKWDGQSVEQIIQENRQQFTAWQKNPESCSPPEGETLLSLVNRVNRFLLELETQWMDKKILIVTHGGVLRSILVNLLNLPLHSAQGFSVPHACLTRLAVYYYGDDKSVKLLGHNVNEQTQ